MSKNNIPFKLDEDYGYEVKLLVDDAHVVEAESWATLVNELDPTEVYIVLSPPDQLVDLDSYEEVDVFFLKLLPDGTLQDVIEAEKIDALTEILNKLVNKDEDGE
jgi:hypothetical protein